MEKHFAHERGKNGMNALNWILIWNWWVIVRDWPYRPESGFIYSQLILGILWVFDSSVDQTFWRYRHCHLQCRYTFSQWFGFDGTESQMNNVRAQCQGTGKNVIMFHRRCHSKSPNCKRRWRICVFGWFTAKTFVQIFGRPPSDRMSCVHPITVRIDRNFPVRPAN